MTADEWKDQSKKIYNASKAAGPLADWVYS